MDPCIITSKKNLSWNLSLDFENAMFTEFYYIKIAGSNPFISVCVGNSRKAMALRLFFCLVMGYFLNFGHGRDIDLADGEAFVLY